MAAYTGSKSTMTFDHFDASIEASQISYAREKYILLPRGERERLYWQAKPLMLACAKMGPASALELLITLGSWLNQQPEVNA